MLVLKRKPEEEITLIGPDGPCTIKVIRLSRGSVSIGIAAPDSTRIDRSERLQREAARPARPAQK